MAAASAGRSSLSWPSSRQLKGEKKTIGMKEKWFVYKGEIDAALARKGITPGTTAVQTNFEPGNEETIDAEAYDAVQGYAQPSRDWLGLEREAVRLLAEEMVKPLVDSIKQQTLALNEKDRIIQEQERQLRLLANLQKQAESEHKAAELKALEVEALKKQIAAVEELRQSAEDQLAQVKSEKESETKAIQEHLAVLSAQLQELKKPKLSWWQKWFVPGDPGPSDNK